MAREIIVHPAQNRHCSSCARETHPCGGSTVIGLTRRQVSVPCGVKSINHRHATTPNATKSQLFLSPSSVGRPPRCRHLVNSAMRDQKAIAPSAFGHIANYLRNDPCQPCALSSGGTARAVGLLDPLQSCTVPKFPENP